MTRPGFHASERKSHGLRPKRIAAVFLILLVLIVQGAGGQSATEQFSPESEKQAVIKQIEKNSATWGNVQRLRVEYETTSKHFAIHRVLAATSAGDLYFFGAHFNRLPWESDMFNQEYYIHDGKSCFQWVFNRAYSEGALKPGEMLSGSIPEDALLYVIPRWPLNTYKMPDGNLGYKVIPPEAIKSDGYHLLSARELILGESCAVFDCNGIDRIWVDIAKGYCIMRRVTRNPHSKLILDHAEATKMSEVSPGLWMPTSYDIELWSQNGPTGHVSTRITLSVGRVSVGGDVPESLFIPKHRPGAIKMGQPNSFTQVLGGGQDLLDEITETLVKKAGLPTKPLPKHAAFPYVAAGLLSGICAGIVVFPRKSRFKKSSRQLDVPKEKTPTDPKTGSITYC